MLLNTEARQAVGRGVVYSRDHVWVHVWQGGTRRGGYAGAGRVPGQPGDNQLLTLVLPSSSTFADALAETSQGQETVGSAVMALSPDLRVV